MSVRCLVASLAILTSACVTSPDETVRTAQMQGMRDVVPGDWALFGCDSGKDSEEKYGRRFTATNSNGQRVSGLVCCGYWFKGCTIRW